MLPFGPVRLTYTQLLTIVVSLAAYAGTMLFAHRTILGKRIRAVASNPMLADITRLQPQHRLHLRDRDRLGAGLPAWESWCRLISGCSRITA